MFLLISLDDLGKSMIILNRICKKTKNIYNLGETMYIMIDNYDSFTYTLVSYFEQLGEKIQVYSNDQISVSEISQLQPTGIIISPGPKNPQQAGISAAVIRAFGGIIPILGVCLGHQAIGYVYGAKIVKGSTPMHGKITSIYHDGRKLFDDLPPVFSVTRYHSLIIDETTFPKDLEINARDESGVIMAISHREFPIYGVQFHPEAVSTVYGHQLIQNFIQLSKAGGNIDS